MAKQKTSNIPVFVSIRLIITVAALIISLCSLWIALIYSTPSYSPSQLLNTTIHIPPAQNATYCTQLGCSNYTQSANYTSRFRLNYSGYLLVSASTPENISLVSKEQYSIANVTNKPVYDILAHKFVRNLFSIATLNATMSPILIPVVAGNETLVFYNNAAYPITAQVKVIYEARK